jgi:hypothetical protein
MSFREFVEFSSGNLRQLYWIALDGKIGVDYVGRFENLERVVQKVTKKGGWYHSELPHTNATKHPPYQEVYDDYTRKLVAQKCEEDIDTFKYTFDKPESDLPADEIPKLQHPAKSRYALDNIMPPISSEALVHCIPLL